MNKEHDPLDNDTSWNTDGNADRIGEHFLEHDEPKKYVVYSNPHTGVGSLGELQEGSPNRYPRRAIRLPQTSEASARASRKRLRDHAVYRQLGACLVLTYAELPTCPKKDVKAFLKKAKKYYSSHLHYAVVTEGRGDETGIRIHHNVLLPASPNLFAVADIWTHGDVFIGINPTDSDIRRMVNYVSKEFVRSFGLNARFMKSKSKTPKSTRELFDTKEDAEAALFAKIPTDATGVSIYDPQCADRKIIYWDTNPNQI